MSNAPRAAQVRRNWGQADSSCTILHVDMDAFYAAIEVADNPSLAGQQVIVGGNERSVVLSATYEARALGVRSAMPVATARRLAPRAIVVPPRMHRYRDVSAAVMAILADVTPTIEQVSVDEAYLDVRSVLRHWASARSIADSIRATVASQLGVTCSVGVATSKLVAKLASTNAKPDGVLVIPRASEVEFVQSLPVGALPGVGARTRTSLAQRGIETVQQLAQSDPSALQYWFGAHGTSLFDLAWARDTRPVTIGREELSIGQERTFAADTASEDDIDRMIVSLADQVTGILRSRNLVGGVIALKIKDADFRVTSRSRKLAHPAADAEAFVDQLRRLWAQSPARGRMIRLVGVRVEQLSSDAKVGVQGTLEDELADRSVPREAVDQAVDAVRGKFGKTALSRASGIRPT